MKLHRNIFLKTQALPYYIIMLCQDLLYRRKKFPRVIMADIMWRIYHLSTSNSAWFLPMESRTAYNFEMFVYFLVFNATFNNISVLLVEETGGPRENHWPVTSHWQTLSHNVVHLSLIEIPTDNISDDRHWLYTIQSWPRWTLNLKVIVTMTMVQYILLATDKINKKLRQLLCFNNSILTRIYQ